jgi:chromatin segregation and condensation protein Rec8/ScpA/Scc1 (kleisin family)
MSAISRQNSGVCTAAAKRALRRRAAVASTLVASLELARDGSVSIAQDAAWTSIRVSRQGDRAAGATEEAVLAASEPTA